jgi:hypothetical protein
MPIFSKKNWEIVGEEVRSGILHILNSGNMPFDLNMAHIALIPKSKNLECVSGFRPTSLCNVLY